MDAWLSRGIWIAYLALSSIFFFYVKYLYYELPLIIFWDLHSHPQRRNKDLRTHKLLRDPDHTQELKNI